MARKRFRPVELLQLEERGGREDLGGANGPERQEVFRVARHKIVRSGGEGAFEDAVVVVLGDDEGDPLHGLDHGRHASDGGDTVIRLPLAETKLLAEDSLELGEDEGRQKQVHLTPTDAVEHLIRLAAGEGERGEQDVRVQDDAHGGLLPSGMDQAGHVLLASKAEYTGRCFFNCIHLFPASLRGDL